MEGGERRGAAFLSLTISFVAWDVSFEVTWSWRQRLLVN